MSTKNCTYDELIFNEACVGVQNNDDLGAWLYELSTDCVSCPFKRVANIARLDLKVPTVKPLVWRIFQNDGAEEYIFANNSRNLHCELHPRFDDFGIYNLSVSKFGCELTTSLEPENSFLPLYVALGIIVIICCILSVTRRCVKTLKSKYKRKNNQTEEKTSKRRIRSIDTVRGISILMMIFVNDGAGGYPILEHATWNGLLIGDLVFPCFMWIMGLCIPLSLSSQLSRKVPRSTICLSIIKRSALLFLFGISLNTLGTSARLENIRIFGVLQRFSIAYITAALMYTFKMPAKLGEFSSGAARALADIYALLSQWFIMGVVVAAHYWITFHLPVPNCPTGYLGPGGNHLDGKYANCSGGSTGYIDRLVLGRNHIYQYPGIVKVYGAPPLDPEGILGCLTSIFQTFLGAQAGQIILCHKDWRNRVLRWLIWSLILGSIGSALHFSNVIPVNKHLWSISFVLVTTCFCLALFTTCYLLIDVIKVWNGGPFRIPGMNALVMYIGHQMCYQIFPFHWKFNRMNTHSWLLAENLWGVTLWTVIAYILHHKKVYINL